jgi:hypothetical protein
LLVWQAWPTRTQALDPPPLFVACAVSCVPPSCVAALSDDPDERAVYAVVVTMLAGLMSLGIGLLRLGFVVNFISKPVRSARALLFVCVHASLSAFVL